ncbi:hypothetical protein [Actinokineospora sp.]|uniref:hypothetical protein n=1 Tax=Actinokineospora sp. TaxID=1872133 RepID=UPI003D6BACCB
MRLPPELRLPAAQAAGSALFSILVAILISLTGALGLWSNSEVRVEVDAKVVEAVGCAKADRPEEVTYQRDGREERVKLDACGHEEGEPVRIALGGETASLAHARTSATTDARQLGVVLCVFAGIAGAGFAELYRRTAGAPLRKLPLGP